MERILENLLKAIQDPFARFEQVSTRISAQLDIMVAIVQMMTFGKPCETS